MIKSLLHIPKSESATLQKLTRDANHLRNTRNWQHNTINNCLWRKPTFLNSGSSKLISILLGKYLTSEQSFILTNNSSNHQRWENEREITVLKSFSSTKEIYICVCIYICFQTKCNELSIHSLSRAFACSYSSIRDGAGSPHTWREEERGVPWY